MTVWATSCGLCLSFALALPSIVASVAFQWPERLLRRRSCDVEVACYICAQIRRLNRGSEGVLL